MAISVLSTAKRLTRKLFSIHLPHFSAFCFDHARELTSALAAYRTSYSVVDDSKEGSPSAQLKSADAHGGVELVTRDRQQIYSERIDVDGNFPI